jgi:hypothetical protein
MRRRGSSRPARSAAGIAGALLVAAAMPGSTAAEANLRTVELREPAQRPRVPPARPANTLRELFDAMSTCWKPPPLDRSKPGTQITIRFSLNRAGEIMGEPRFTYSTPNLSTEIKAAYQHAVATSLTRCAPFSLSEGLGGAIAGRPISIRVIDDIEPRMEKPI